MRFWVLGIYKLTRGFYGFTAALVQKLSTYVKLMSVQPTPVSLQKFWLWPSSIFPAHQESRLPKRPSDLHNFETSKPRFAKTKCGASCMTLRTLNVFQARLIPKAHGMQRPRCCSRCPQILTALKPQWLGDLRDSRKGGGDFVSGFFGVFRC